MCSNLGFVSILLWYVLLYLFIVSQNFSIYTFFDAEVMHLYILFFKVLINLSTRTDFPLLRIIILEPWFYWSVVKFTAFIYPYFVSFAIRFIQDILKSISTCNAFFQFKGITHVYFLRISIRYNKKWIPLLNLLINCISARSAPQILSIKCEYTFFF